jgi:hypothetical protein
MIAAWSPKTLEKLPIDAALDLVRALLRHARLARVNRS